MFKDGTVFVVGAGASCELKMPTGKELAASIASGANVSFGHLDDPPTGDRNLRWALQRHYRGNEINERLGALRNIAAGIYMAESIDNYIDRHRAAPFVPEMGKFLIAYYLLGAEASSRLRVNSDRDRPLDLPAFHDTWLDPFSHTLFSGISAGEEDRIGRNITIICFNYDRCIERYLQEAITRAFHVNRSHAHRIVGNISILRPYGSLGTLPADPRYPLGEQLAFGANVDSVNLPAVGQRLKTYTEQVEDENLLAQIRAAVRDSSQLVFLGFGFHQQNIDLLTGSPLENVIAKQTYYSGLGIPEQSVETILRRTWPMCGISHEKQARGRQHFERDGSAHHVMSVHRMALSA